MPTLPVNDDGAVLYYEDSGAPYGLSDYTTVILLHGFACHSTVFRPLFPHASTQNLRIVTVNQREYPGSSPLNEREMANLWSSDPDRQATFLREAGIELANFIARFIDQEKLPSPKLINGEKVNGVAFLAWSQGNGLLLSMLANISRLDARTRATLEQYLRTVIMYDTACTFIGVQIPLELFPGLQNQDSSPDEMAEGLVDWICTYQSPFPAPETISDEELRDSHDMYQATGDKKYMPTYSRVPKSAIKAFVAPEIIPRTASIASFAPEVYDESCRRALFDTKGVLKDVRVVAIWPEMSVWICTIAHKTLTNMFSRPSVAGKTRRNVETVTVKDAHHLYHFDQPEEFVRLISTYL